jgi:Protein of unknown function (DUF2971)
MSTLFKYMPADGAIKTLENNTLMFSHPLSFNDPMDTRTSVCDEFLNVHELSSTLRRRFIEMIVDASYDPSLCQMQSVRAMIEKYKYPESGRLPGRIEMEKIIGRDYFFEQAAAVCREDNLVDVNWKKGLARCLVSCFTEHDPSNEQSASPSQLMWSHYGDKHRGAALGFEFVGEFAKKLRPVTYSPDLPELISEDTVADFVMGLRQQSHLDLSIQSLFRTKSKCWEYEKEWRIIADYPSPPGVQAFEPFKAEELNSVFIGTRCSTENRDRVIELVGNYPRIKIS